MTDVSNHLNSSLTTNTKCETITTILHRMREKHNIEHTPNTRGYSVIKPLHYHLSHRFNYRKNMIVYHHQHKHLPKNNDYSIYLTSQSQLINRSEMSPNLYEFKVTIHTKPKSNHYVIIECERTRSITLVTQSLYQLLNARPNMTTLLILESGWVFLLIQLPFISILIVTSLFSTNNHSTLYQITGIMS